MKELLEQVNAAIAEATEALEMMGIDVDNLDDSFCADLEEVL